MRKSLSATALGATNLSGSLDAAPYTNERAKLNETKLCIVWTKDWSE